VFGRSEQIENGIKSWTQVKANETHIKSSDSLFLLILGGLLKTPDVDGKADGGTVLDNPSNNMTALDVP
jgi:hypothetical protein